MIDIERTMIGKTALDTFAAKFRNKSELPFPIPSPLVDFVASFVPMRLLTFWITKSRFAWRSALGAFSIFRPAVREIACLPAIVPIAPPHAIKMHFILFAAVATGAFNAGLFHEF